jgi:hypothetical protein
MSNLTIKSENIERRVQFTTLAELGHLLLRFYRDTCKAPELMIADDWSVANAMRADMDALRCIDLASSPADLPPGVVARFHGVDLAVAQELRSAQTAQHIANRVRK